jgi:hypothetical protein
MCAVRVYLPVTLPGLAAAGLGPGSAAAATSPALIEVAATGASGCAVTPALREWYREGDLDELEYAAMTRAALASLRLLARDGGDRRAVLAADVPDDMVLLDPDVDPAAVVVMGPVRLDQVVSAHVDDPSATADVGRAAELLVAADAGDQDAQFTIDGLDDHELQWYDAQEIRFLLG